MTFKFAEFIKFLLLQSFKKQEKKHRYVPIGLIKTIKISKKGNFEEKNFLCQ